MLCTLPSFTILKSLHPTGQPACLEKMTSVRGQDCPTHRAQASEATTSPLSIRLNDDPKNPLESNKPGPPKAPLKAFSEPPQAPPPQDPDANQYSQQNLNGII